MDARTSGDATETPLEEREPEMSSTIEEPEAPDFSSRDGGPPTRPRRGIVTTGGQPKRGGPDWRHRLVLLAVIFTILLAIAIPGVVAAVSGVRDYDEIKALGLSGVHHLLNAKDIIEGTTVTSGSSSGCTVATPTGTPTSGATSSGTTISSLLSGNLPDAATVQKAEVELKAAQADFKQLQGKLSHPDWAMSVAGSAPGLSGKFATARGLANAGYDVTTMGITLADAAIPLLTRLHGASLGGQSLLTQKDITSLQAAMDTSVKLLADIRVQTALVNVGDLPVCAAQRDEYTQLVAKLPKAQDDLQQADALIQPIGWLAGVDGPRHFLVQELDSTELRATGGFSGQYGILTVQNGKIGDFSLLPVDYLDYRATSANPAGLSNGWVFGDNGSSTGRRPPDTYSWWPIANWGLRDSNLNADFPTDAKLVMNVFKNEATNSFFKNLGGGNTDGLIQFTPNAIGHVLLATGPITVPVYNVTVTGDDLADMIHYYQLTPAGQAENLKLFPQDGTVANARHEFAQALAKALETRLRGLSLKQLVPVAKQAFKDMQAHDIQFYVTDQKLENLLLQHAAGGAISTQAGVDGFMVVHTNWSAGKINDHINSLEQDDVTLDDKGGATHNLTITVENYNANIIPKDFVSYWDYVRIYAPKQAQLKNADGFQSTTQLCTSNTCKGNPYPGFLECTGGRYTPGPRTNTILGNSRNPPLMTLGGPTATTSDVPNLAMWGGNIVVPLGCTATLTLSWYVPNIAATSTSKVAAGVAPYTEMIQRQGGTEYQAKVTLHPAPHVAAEGKKTVTYNANLTTDLRFTFGATPQPPAP